VRLQFGANISMAHAGMTDKFTRLKRSSIDMMSLSVGGFRA